ncbi:uncharacterized protein LOC116340607 [Contarinia nasturtii]|uniref:uncharacterized protein LOC116340607 n=1 Tax=Contarinia nasturtii TaxID=265458 RepID=UPI0012D46706|nr:uncharacterized protein LOC116340607 [Contarinia nasturtii]XP_031623052.1 uncharacterized protein LOC116340607 [Contarinia nasturtii]
MYRVILFTTVVLMTILDVTEAIKCYRCTVTSSPRENRTEQLCAKFSESDEFTVDCPYSTMCMKKIFRLQLENGTNVETVNRNCADQKKTDQVFKQGTWQNEITIEEPYAEGCMNQTSDTVYCYCRGSMCNTAPKDSPSYHTDAMAVIFVFNAMKYLRSID